MNWGLIVVGLMGMATGGLAVFVRRSLGDADDVDAVMTRRQTNLVQLGLPIGAVFVVVGLLA